MYPSLRVDRASHGARRRAGVSFLLFVRDPMPIRPQGPFLALYPPCTPAPYKRERGGVQAGSGGGRQRTGGCTPAPYKRERGGVQARVRGGGLPSRMPWCFVLPYIRVKHASWFRALACVCPQTSPRRALSSLCVAVCRESVVSRDSRFVCAHGCRSSDGCGSQNC